MKSLDLVFPKDWTELSQSQLKFVFRLIDKQYSYEMLKILCLFRFNNLKILASRGDGSYLLSGKNKNGKKDLFIVYPVQIAEILPLLSWLDSVSDFPVRLNRIRFHKALAPDFQGVPFEKFIMADNLYAAFLDSKDYNILDELASVLYDTGHKLKGWQRINCFYWFNSLKIYFSSVFSDFFQTPSDNQDHNVSQIDSMNAQIRALTKGDISKEKEILAMDTWRALYELNAQAKEYHEFNTKYGKK